MNLKTATNKKTGRTYLSIVHAYRDEAGRPKAETVRSLGYLDELEKEFDDPVAHFKAVVAEMEASRRAAVAPVTVTFYPKQKMRAGVCVRKNLGFCALSAIYHEFGLKQFFDNRQRHAGFSYSLDAVFRLLVFDRILDPHSKSAAWEGRDSYFESFVFSKDDMYRALSRIAKLKEPLIGHLDKKTAGIYGRRRDLFYYDVTNYYFEIDKEDGLRRDGVSKEHRPDPIVQMGLFLDTGGLPVAYDLFPGNTNDCLTLIDMLSASRKDLSAGRVVVVADKGLNTADNIAALLSKGDGYIFSQTVRGASDEMRRWAVSHAGYPAPDTEGFKMKSRIATRKIKVSTQAADKARGIKKKTKAVEITEKQVAYFSPKYAERARRERADAVAKARDIAAHPKKLDRMLERSAAKYVKGVTYNTETGEVVETARAALAFDEDRLAQEEALDGYYIICTSEHAAPDEKIVESYRGLWRIEETFRVTKSDLCARPVYLSRAERICAHFLVCFVALLILRVLQMRCDWRHSAGAIAKTLKEACGTLEAENWYLFDHYDDVLDNIGRATGLDFSRRRLRKIDTVQMVALTKKRVRK
jgi:transposase